MVAHQLAALVVNMVRDCVTGRRLWKCSAVLVVMAVLILPATALAAGPGEGSIEGHVVNGSKGGGSVANQDVVLKAMLNGAEAGLKAGRLDAEGRFSFKELSTEPGYSYQVTVTFQQADYVSAPLAFVGDEVVKTTLITVYDSTASPEAIAVGIAHTVVYVEPGSLRVREFFYIVNESDRTYIGSRESAALGRKETLQFFLPGDATDLEPQAGLDRRRVSRNKDGFVDTMPVTPDGREVVFAYRVRYQPGPNVFFWKAGYPTASYDFLVHGQGINLSSDRLTAREPLYIGGAPFSRLSGNGLSAGDTVAIKFSVLSGSGKERSSPSRLPLVAAALGAGVLAFWLIRKRRAPAPVEDRSEERRQRLLAEIAQLDEDFESGAVNEQAYRDLRAAKKSQLVAVIKRARQKASDG